MDIKRDIIVIILLGGILLLIVYFTSVRDTAIPQNNQESTTPAQSMDETPKPDDSEPGEATITVKMNAPVTVLGVNINPIELIEDSRCPYDVVCIQAGTVRLRVEITNPLGERALVAMLNTPIQSAHETIELIDVLPLARAEIPIRTNEYRFVFKVTRK